MRIVRSLGKMGALNKLFEFPKIRNDLQCLWKNLCQANASNHHSAYGFQSRVFLRCLDDQTAALELKALCLAGVFNQWLPHLKEILLCTPITEIEWLINQNSHGSVPKNVLKRVYFVSLSD